jgi:hypothetical protein
VREKTPEALMSPTQTIPAQLAQDLANTMSRLRMARLIGDHSEARVAERRLNWLLDKLPRKAA